MAKDTDVVKNKSMDLEFTENDMMMIMMVVMMVYMMSQMFSPLAQNANRFFTSQSFQGDVETENLFPNGTTQYWDLVNQPPYTPLISLFCINRGASRVYLAINSAQDWMEIWPGETRVVDHTGAEKRIEIIFYKCDLGNTSILEVEGHF